MIEIPAPVRIAIVGSVLVFAILLNFSAQTPQPAPSALPEPSPSASPSATPAPTPSPTPLPGNQNFHQWGSITVFNGLPSDSVRAITQTPDGVMWFGTDNGLARFDGRRIQNITIGDSDAIRILALECSNTGELWIGTSAGAYLSTEGRFQPIANTESIAITSISVGTTVYLGTNNGSVLRVNETGDGRSAETISSDTITDGDTPVVVTDVLATDGRLLAATDGRGVLVLNDRSATDLQMGPRPPSVHALERTNSGEVWFGADAARGASGLYSVDPDGRRVRRLPAPTGKVLAVEANEGGVWAGTERYGLFHVKDGKLAESYTFANTSGGLRSDTIFTLFTDREGVLWIGTNRGASRFDQQGSFQQTVSEIPNSNFVRTLWWNGRALYAGSNRGLFEYNWKHETWEKVAGFGERVIYDIGVGSQTILVATASGTYDFRGRLVIAGDTRSIESFSNVTYAAIMGRGVVRISEPRHEVVFPHETATALIAGSDRLWIGTGGNGLYSFDGKTTKLEVAPETLQAGAVWNMTHNVDGSIWIAGQHGVFRVANGQVEKVIEAEDVRDVYIDHSDFWGAKADSDIWAATTTRGLIHARRDERFGWVLSSIGFEQGMPSEKAFSIVRADGIVIGTNRGVVNYRPGSVPPKLIVTRILSQRVHDLAEATSTIALEYPQNSLLIEVAGQSSRTFPEEFQYAFILKNGKGEEVDRRLSNDPQYAPSDLSPGNYSIEAIAFNRDLLASDPLFISFSIERAPFPWTATALGVLLVLSLIALVWAVVERRRITQRNRELAAARLDLANEAERERRRIARDLHDQTLADLRHLMMETDKIPAAGGDFRKEIESISTDIRRICEDLSPSVLENVGLVAALEFLLSHTIENYRFSADEDLEDGIDLPLDVQLQLYRITQEVLANIKQHSSADLVEMRVEVPDGTRLQMTIKDNGQPFDVPAGLDRGRGISNIRARASFINAGIEWKQRRKGGNVFRLRITKPREKDGDS